MLTYTFFSVYEKSQKVLDKETICTKEAEMEVLSWASNFSIHAIETFVHVLERMQGSLLRYENRDKVWYGPSATFGYQFTYPIKCSIT